MRVWISELCQHLSCWGRVRATGTFKKDKLRIITDHINELKFAWTPYIYSDVYSGGEAGRVLLQRVVLGSSPLYTRTSDRHSTCLARSKMFALKSLSASRNVLAVEIHTYIYTYYTHYIYMHAYRAQCSCRHGSGQ